MTEELSFFARQSQRSQWDLYKPRKELKLLVPNLLTRPSHAPEQSCPSCNCMGWVNRHTVAYTQECWRMRTTCCTSEWYIPNMHPLPHISAQEAVWKLIFCLILLARPVPGGTSERTSHSLARLFSTWRLQFYLLPLQPRSHARYGLSMTCCCKYSFRNNSDYYRVSLKTKVPQDTVVAVLFKDCLSQQWEHAGIISCKILWCI